MTFDALRFFHDGSTGTPDPAPAPALRAPTSKPAGYAGLRTEKILAASRFMLSRISLFPVQAIVLPHSVEHSISVPSSPLSHHLQPPASDYSGALQPRSMRGTTL